MLDRASQSGDGGQSDGEPATRAGSRRGDAPLPQVDPAAVTDTLDMLEDGSERSQEAFNKNDTCTCVSVSGAAVRSAPFFRAQLQKLSGGPAA